MEKPAAIVQIPIERPRTVKGPLRWLRRNLFRTWLDSALTVIVLLMLVSILASFLQWVIAEAQWTVITANFRVLMQGLYPIEEGWRLAVAALLTTMLAGISWGTWGHLFLRNAITLLLGVTLFIVLPILSPAFSDSSPIGQYFGREIVPLVEVLRVPVVLLLVCLLTGYSIGFLARRSNSWRAHQLNLIGWLMSIPIIFFLVRGLNPDTQGLPLVPTSNWGGLLLTFMMAFVAIVGCFPLGILLALGRTSGASAPKRSALPNLWYVNPLQWFVAISRWWRNLGPYPVITLFCTIYIEFFRGIPLITVFFTSNLLLPLALGSTEIEPVVRAMIALILFEAAYIAEIVRGGLQAMPPGQIEAAASLGLNPIYITLFITLPQALRIVIPALVGQFITMFKDTSLVAIVGLLDLLGIAQGVLAQQQFAGRQREMYVFIALVYFVFSFGMSRAAHQLERSGSGKLQIRS